MSIINDALKKAQKNLSKQRHKAGGPGTGQPHGTYAPPNQTGTAQSAASADRLKTFIIAALFIIILALGSVLVLILKNKPTASSPAGPTEGAGSPRGVSSAPTTQDTGADTPYSASATANATNISPSATTTPADPVRSPNQELVVDGIVKVDNQMVALINGDDYVEGDRVRDMEVTRISSTQVELQAADGKTVALSVKGK
jgi:hypothetical protein